MKPASPRRKQSRTELPISVEVEMRTGAIAYWQGEHYQSRADKNGISLLDYVQALFSLLRQKQARNILMIGCAGGSLATMLSRQDCTVVAVDVNPQAFPLARRYFGLPPEVETRVADGYAFLRSTRRKFDAIVLDAFHGGSIAEELLSPEFFAQAAKRLNGHGAIFANVHVPNDSAAMPGAMARLMATAFPVVRMLDRPGTRHRNAIVVCGAVRGLKRPKLLMPPAIETAKLGRALAAMRFQTFSARPPQ